MKISVVIPNYNYSQFVAHAIESVLSQTRKADEIIVVDDGSSDDSVEIIKSYPVKLVQQVNKGLPSARNTGVMNATGDYVFFLDADDMILENCLKRIEETAEQTGADIISPSFKCFGVSNDEVILMQNPQLEDFETGNRIGCFSAVKREALLEVGGYNPRMVWGFEDYDLWFDLLKRGKRIATIQEILVLYRTKPRPENLRASSLHEALAHKPELLTQIIKNHPEIKFPENWNPR